MNGWKLKNILYENIFFSGEIKSILASRYLCRAFSTEKRGVWILLWIHIFSLLSSSDCFWQWCLPCFEEENCGGCNARFKILLKSLTCFSEVLMWMWIKSPRTIVAVLVSMRVSYEITKVQSNLIVLRGFIWDYLVLAK